MKNTPVFSLLFAVFVCGLSFAASNKSVQEMTIGEANISLNPKLAFSLPNGVVDIFIREAVEKASVDFKYKYDFLDNSIYNNLNFMYGLSRIYVGTELADKTDFEEFLQSSVYIQRDRYLMPYVMFGIADEWKVKTGTKIGNTYTISLDTNVALDQGRNVAQIVSLQYEYEDKKSAIDRKQKMSFDITRAFQYLGGEYDYTQLDFSWDETSRPVERHYVETNIKLGYPLNCIKKPLTEYYWLGGYEMLKGYTYKQFRGDALAYAQFKYRIPIIQKRDMPKIHLDIFSFDAILEAGKVGSKEIFNSISELKTSAGIGLGCELTLFKKIKMKFNVSVNQPAEQFAPKLYFNISAISYIFSKDRK